MTEPVEDEITEMYDADIPRVDLVGKAANGVPNFLIMKSADDGTGLVSADEIRDLIKGAHVDASMAPGGPVRDDVTISGSAGAIADMIHKAAQRSDPVEKAKRSTAEQNDLPDSAFAYIEPGGHKDDEGKTVPRSKRHFDITDAPHVRDALARVGGGAAFADEAMPKIRAAAKKFGIDVSKEQTMTEPVVKADDAGLEVGDLVDAPTGGTAETVPGSPDWENLDADTAVRAISVLGRAKAAVEWLASREAQEYAAGDADDGEKAYDLDDVCCALDCAIATLGAFAAGERLEAELADELGGVMKAAAALDADMAPLATLEGWAPVVKAGKVLSSANEAAIRGAVDQLQKVLAALPPVDDSGQPVAKEKEATVAETATQTVEKTTDTGTAEAGPADTAVEKAKGDPQVAVYDANGNLVGVTDPSAITPLSDAKAPASGDDAPTDGAPAAEPAAAAAPDATVIPGTNTVQAPPQTDNVDDVTKSGDAVEKTTDGDNPAKTAASELAAAFAEALTPVAKQFEQHTELADMVKGLQERVEEIAKMPDDRRSPRFNGAGGTAHAGQPDQVTELRKAVEDAPDDAARLEAEKALGYAVIKERFTR